MPQEIERKFLVSAPWKDRSTSHSHITQGYICSAPGRTVRVRRRDDKAYLTIKGPSDDNGLSRYEFEKEITLSEAEALFALCEPGMIDKVRWLVPCGSHVCEVDEFLGENKGLVVAEIELSSEGEAYERPDFLGEEITGRKRYYNAQLSRHPYALWREEKAAE